VIVDIGMVLFGVCLGVLFVATGVPEIKVVPSIAAAVLGLSAAILAASFDQGDPVPVWVFLVAVFVTTTLYTPLLWKRALPEMGNSYGWFFRETFVFLHSRRLRDDYRSRRAA
jgi:hypothetical protein